MSRPSNTYRAARRNQWRLIVKETGTKWTRWMAFNASMSKDYKGNDFDAKP